jgi:predicted transcriptional regulator
MDLNLHIPEDLESVLSDVTDKQAYAIDAIRQRAERDKAEYEAWVLKEIQDGIDAADRGDFVPKEEMNAFFAKHGVNVRD